MWKILSVENKISISPDDASGYLLRAQYILDLHNAHIIYYEVSTKSYFMGEETEA